ncbi:hypothetical protein WV31_10900 [Magnetospirillum sp. ME-1]|nr:hypothetical protein WV31_10900 [Magnetospirillum sp. ME-1]
MRMQTRAMSAMEAGANTGIGFCLSWALAAFVYPLFGVEASPSQTLAITIAFTALSVVRSYALRRAFELLRRRSSRQEAAAPG